MGCAAPNPLHWQDLRARIANHKLCKPGVDVNGYNFCLSFLNARYRLDVQTESIVEITPNPDRVLSQEFQILLIRYLTCPHLGELTSRLVTENELPGGPTFFRGPHALPTHEVVAKYGSDPDRFVARGLALGGKQVSLGDRAVCFEPFLRIPLTYVLWQADDEFRASISVLFDSSISTFFPLDMVFLLVGQVSRRLLEEK